MTASISKIQETARSDGLLSFLLEELDIGVTVSDLTRPDAPLIYVNGGFLRLTGYERNEVMGHNCRFLQVPETDPHQVEAIRQAVANRHRVTVELLNARKSGERFWNRLELVPISDGTGRINRYAGLQRDVTAERRASMDLEEKSSRLKAVLDTTHESIITVNAKGDILTFNTGSVDMFGYSPDEVIGRSVNVLLPSAARGDHNKYMQAFAEGPDSARAMANFRRINGVSKDGRSISIMASISKVTVGGEPLMTVVARDVSQVQQQENALRSIADEATRAQLRAERASNAKSIFLANMSHELRTPLNAIIGFTDMMRNEVLGPVGVERYQEYLDAVHDSGQHLLRLISDILDISKIEAGKIELTLSELDPVRETVNVIDMFTALSEERGLSVRIVTDGAPLAATLDPKAYRQILTNLMSNAVKFSRPGGRVQVSLSRGVDREMILTVTDSGIGIRKDDLKLIGRPFVQGQADRGDTQMAGTGLGLAICKALVDLHSGTLEIDSIEGVGTTVTVTLPIKPVKAMDSDTQDPGPS